MSRLPLVLRGMVLLVFFSFAGPLNAQFVPGASKSSPTFVPREDGRAGEGASIFQGIAQFQRELNTQMTGFFREAVSGTPGAFWLLMGISFLYGVFHSLLPGHQKLAVGAYFLSRSAPYREAWILGGAFSLFHALFSLGVILVFRFVLGSGAGDTLGLSSWWGQALAAGGMTLLGLGLVIQKAWSGREVLRLGNLAKVRRVMEIPHRTEREVIPSYNDPKKIWVFLVLAALLPCPGSLLVLLFALSTGQVLLGLGAVAAVAAGMGLVLAVIGSLVIFLRRRGQDWSGLQPGSPSLWAAELVSLVFLAALGFLLLPPGLITGS